MSGFVKMLQGMGFELYAGEAKRYFARAVILVGCLMLVALAAPYLPSVLIPVVLIAFSVVSTAGAMYYTIVNRIHRQYRLAKDGQLSRLNRKWSIRLAAYLVVFLASGLFFILEAPTWNALEWVLTWLAIPLYFAVYMFAKRALKREYATRFYKAQAMRWSFFVVGVALCLIYALLAVLVPTAEYETLRAAFDSVAQPYAAAPSALMGDIGKLAWYADVVTAFGISQISNGSAIIAFICRFVVYAGVFFGLVNQFGFCLLSKEEVRSEFQLLPAGEDDGGDSREPIRRRYVIIVATVLIASMTIFLALEFEVAKAKATSAHTRIEAFVDEQAENIIAIVDGKLADIRELEERIQDNVQLAKEVLQEQSDALTPLVNDYYDRCRENVDSYLDWLEGPFGWWAKVWKDAWNLSANDAIRAFKERISEGTNGSQIESLYKQYQERLAQIRSQAASDLSPAELMKDLPSAEIMLLLGPSLDGSSAGNAGDDAYYVLNLWMPLDDAGLAKDVLLGDGDADRDAMREGILSLIEQAREDTLSAVGFDGSTQVEGDQP